MTKITEPVNSSRKKIYVGHSRNFDFQTELYEPLRHSKLNQLSEIILPHENGRDFFDSKEVIKGIDFMIAEVSYPSTGLGIELGRANFYNIPIIGVYKKGIKISNSVKHVIKYLVEYSTADELIEQLKKIIAQ